LTFIGAMTAPLAEILLQLKEERADERKERV
jgi:hypothetical protein